MNYECYRNVVLSYSVFNLFNRNVTLQHPSHSPELLNRLCFESGTPSYFLAPVRVYHYVAIEQACVCLRVCVCVCLGAGVNRKVRCWYYVLDRFPSILFVIHQHIFQKSELEVNTQ